jgi:hypothetical protein
MHTRAKAHVRAAEKYMHDKDDRNTRKAIAHFGRAMHYFGANEEKTEPSEERSVFGFIVESKKTQSRSKPEIEKMAHLHIDGRVRVLVCSPDGTFRTLYKDERRYQLIGETYEPKILALIKHQQAANPGYMHHNLTDRDLRVEHMLVGTQNVGASDALLIRGNKERGHIVLDLGGILSRPNHGDHSALVSFLHDSQQTKYTIRSLETWGIESIELEKIAVDGSLVANLAYCSAQNTVEHAKIKERLTESKSPLSEQLRIYDGGSWRDYGNRGSETQIMCEKGNVDPLICWIQEAGGPGLYKDQVSLEGEMKTVLEREKQAAKHKKEAELNHNKELDKRANIALAEKIKAIGTGDQGLAQLHKKLHDTDADLRRCKLDAKLKSIDAQLESNLARLYKELTVKYVMIVLSKKVPLIKERAVVECILKRDFVNSDAVMLLPRKKTEVPKTERPWWYPFSLGS